jgi:hypothetical protein
LIIVYCHVFLFENFFSNGNLDFDPEN